VTDAWGLSLKEDSPQTETNIFSVSIQILKSCFLSSDIESAAITIDNFLKELRDVRTGVQKEYNWFKDHSSSPSSSSNSNSSSDLQRKRLIYLFINDLTIGVSGGVTGNILQSKYNRDTLKDQPISLWVKCLTWLTLFLVNMAFLFYIYLFAMQQTQQRQRAWFQSFLIWLIFEMFISSSAVVLLTHLLIPLWAYSDVRKIKSKLLSDLLVYRTRSTKLLNKANRTQKRNLNSLFPSSLSSSGASSGPSSGASPSGSGDGFNAAKYLYTSWRVASLFPDLPESPFIVSFTTPWPKECFKRRKQEVSTVYDKRYTFIYQAISRVLIFFLSSLIHFPPFLQDLLLQFFANSTFGYIFLWMIRLYQINPFLPILPIGLLGLLLHFYFFHERTSLRIRNLTKLSPTPEEGEAEGEEEAEVTKGRERGIVREESGSAVHLSTHEPHLILGGGEQEEGDEFEEDEGDHGAIRNPSRVEINRKGRKLSMQLFQNLHQEIASRDTQQQQHHHHNPEQLQLPVPSPTPAAVTSSSTMNRDPTILDSDSSSSDEFLGSEEGDVQFSSSEDDEEETKPSSRSIEWEDDEDDEDMNSEIIWSSDEEDDLF
jgi:hypothetical protein